MNPAGVEETGSEDVPGTEQTENKDDEEKLEREKTLLNLNIRNKSRNFHVKSDFTRRPPGSGQPNRKPPCPCCSSPNHGVWACLVFQQKSYDDKWTLAKEKRLCFRCLGSDHQGKSCMKSQTCQINGCRGNHHRLLHENPPATDPPMGTAQPVVNTNSYPSLPHGRGQLAPLYHLRERTVMPREG